MAAIGQQSVSEGDRKYIFEASSQQIDKTIDVEPRSGLRSIRMMKAKKL